MKISLDKSRKVPYIIYNVKIKENLKKGYNGYKEYNAIR